MKPFLTQTQKQKQYIYLVQSNHSIDGGKLPLFCDHKTEDSFTCPKSNKHVNGVWYITTVHYRMLVHTIILVSIFPNQRTWSENILYFDRGTEKLQTTKSDEKV